MKLCARERSASDAERQEPIRGLVMVVAADLRKMRGEGGCCGLCEVGQRLCGGRLGGLMTAKEQLRQVVAAMGEGEAGRVLRLLCSPSEDPVAGSLAVAGVGDETLTVKQGKAKGGVRPGAVVRRRISIDALARELGRFKRPG